MARRLRVLLFGAEARACGKSSVEVELAGPSPTCGQLRVKLLQAQPALGPVLKSARLAVNHAFVDDAHVLREGDEIALIGMVSGG
jgi:molybdopterin converting factor small subunit